MIIKISKKASSQDIRKAFETASKHKKSKKGFPAGKFFGKLKRGLDGLAYQRQLRNEWD